MLHAADCILPDWPTRQNVRAFFTTRAGGISQGDLASLNLGRSVGDDPLAVAENRRRVAEFAGYAPRWMSQVHGIEVADLDLLDASQPISADAAVSRQRGTVCTAMVADCLPVLFTDRAGSVVAAAHVGWRGLAAGVLEATIVSMRVAPQNLMVWLGPAIGPDQFEVGADVFAAFAGSATAFRPFMAEGVRKYHADIFALARLRLTAAGMDEAQIYGGGVCTVSDAARFFSYRREGKSGKKSGRMAALIYLD